MTPLNRNGRFTGDFADSMSYHNAYADEEDYKYHLPRITLDGDDLIAEREYAEQLLHSRYNFREHEKFTQKLKVAKAKRLAQEAKERRLKGSDLRVGPLLRGYLNTLRTENITKTHVPPSL